jgi:hypothetical protein
MINEAADLKHSTGLEYHTISNSAKSIVLIILFSSLLNHLTLVLKKYIITFIVIFIIIFIIILVLIVITISKKTSWPR